MTENKISDNPDSSTALFRVRRWWADLPGNTRGAIWILGAAIVFTAMTSLIKLAGQDLHVTQILLIRQVVMTGMVLPVIVRDFPGSLITRHPMLHVARVVLAATAMLCGFTAIIHLPLADATAIGFAKAFFLTIFAILFLKETVGIRRWAATIVGFIGILVMVRPTGAESFNIYGLYAVAGAAAAGLVMTIIRKLSQVEAATTILTYQAVFVGLIMLVPAIWYWQTPTFGDWMLLLAIGVVSYMAQYANIRAFREGEATAIASLDYTRLLYATLMGGILFAQWPDRNTILGAGIVIAAALYTVQREARLGRKLARASDGRGYSN